MAQVILENVTKKFGDITAVDGVDMTIDDHQRVVLVGPSGCGKSTVLRLIAGLEDPTSGSIRIGGQIVNDVLPKDRDIAMVFQSYALYPHMSVERNLAFGLKMRKVPKPEIERRVRRTADGLGIGDLLDRKPAQLSGGQQQRVAVGRAIVREPSVFLLDEPLSNLDAKLRVAMRSELVELHRQLRTTMIYVTHDQVEAMTMGERIIVMNAGRVLQSGSPVEIYDTPASRFVAEFIGSPPMNILDAVVRIVDATRYVEVGQNRLALTDHVRGAAALTDGRRVLFGIRPENIRVGASAEVPAGWGRLQARAGMCQHLGADAILELDCSGQRLSARVDPHLACTRDQPVDVEIDMSRCRLFDFDTEQAI